MNLWVDPLFISIPGWMCRRHLLTSGSRPLLSPPSLPPSHPPIPPDIILPSLSLEGACFGRAGEKHDVVGSRDYVDGGSLPTIKTTSWVLFFIIPDSIARTLLLADWRSGGAENLRAGMGGERGRGDLCDIEEKLRRRRSGVMYCRGAGAGGWKFKGSKLQII